MSEPLSTQCSNSGFPDRWTCPGCYTDFVGVKEGNNKCANCGRMVVCTLEYEPVCFSRLEDEDTP